MRVCGLQCVEFGAEFGTAIAEGKLALRRSLVGRYLSSGFEVVGVGYKDFRDFRVFRYG